MKYVISIAVCVVALGCGQRMQPVWVDYYQPVSQVTHSPTNDKEIEVQQAPYDALAGDQQVAGYTIIGVSSFRCPMLVTPPASPQSSLYEQARKAGAHRVLWAIKPAGEVAQTVMVPGPASPAYVPPPPPQPSSYRVTSNVYPGAYGQSRIVSTVKPEYETPGFWGAANQGLQQGYMQGAAAAANEQPYTYYVQVYDYIAVYYRRAPVQTQP